MIALYLNEITVRKLTPDQIARSITPDALLSFEDGRSYKTLKKHLARLGLTPQDYRAKWGLPDDYPMVAEAYSNEKSLSAKYQNLGRRSNDIPDR